jgi:tetratricopeptide (TPR) repeat protein
VTFGGDDATALAVATIALLHLGHDFEAASGAIARALAVNGSSAIALYFGAHIHALKGDVALAEDYAPRALRLSPFDSAAFCAYEALGLVHIRERRFDEAAADLAKAVQANPRFSVLYVYHAAALALAGRVEEAKSVAKHALELDPNFHVGPWEPLLPRIMAPELWRPLIDGYRLAGLPE